MTHAVSRLRTARLARSSKPFLVRGGPRGESCAGCCLRPNHCQCALRPAVPTRLVDELAGRHGVNGCGE